MPSGRVGVVEPCPSVPWCSQETGVAAAPQACRSLSPPPLACSRLPVSSCLSLLGHKPLGRVRPPALQVQPPELSSLVVGEVPPEPDWLALAAKQVASSEFIFLS